MSEKDRLDYSETIDGFIEQTNEDLEELTNQKNFSTLKTGFEQIKQALYDFGYKLSGKQKPEEALKVNYAEKIASGELSSESLINTLLKMDDEYRKNVIGVEILKPTVQPEITLERKEYDPKTEAELLLEAESALKPSYEENVNDATLSYQSALEKSAEQLIETGTEEAYERYGANETYLENLSEHQEDMILRGLVNSTVNSEGVKEIERANAIKVERIDKEYDERYRKLEAERRLRESEYENAVASYDLNYALDLQTKLQKLKTEEEKRLEEINEYNLNQAKLEAKYKEDALKQNIELRAERERALYDALKKEREDERQNGVSPQKKAEYASRVERAKSFYRNYNVDAVKAMIENERGELAVLLGDAGLLELYKWNVSRG